MMKSLAIRSSFVAGLALIGSLFLAPQEAAAGFRGGGFHGGGFHGGGAPRPAMHVTSFRPAFHPVFHTMAHVGAPRIQMSRYHGGGRPFHDAGLVRQGHADGMRHAGLVRQGHEHGLHHAGRDHTRLARLEHNRGEHKKGEHGRRGFGVDAPDVYPNADAEPDSAAPAEGGSASVDRRTMGVAMGNAPTDRPASSLQTATGASIGTCTATNGSFVNMTFAPKATASDISLFLKAYNAAIVDGPAKDASYRIRLSDRPMAPRELLQAIQSIRSQTDIVSSVSSS